MYSGHQTQELRMCTASGQIYGEVAEWFKVPPWRGDVGQPTASSNLALSASWENANLEKQARGARRAARIGFERAFLAKRKGIYQ